MKFTGILASLAVASTATAAAVPNLDITKIQSTVTRLDGVLDTIGGALGASSTSTTTKSELSNAQTELLGIHDTLNDLVASIVGGIDSNELLQGVLDLAGGLVTTVENALGYDDNVPDFGILSQTIQSRIESGDLDASGLESVLTVLGGNTGLARLNSVLSKTE